MDRSRAVRVILRPLISSALAMVIVSIFTGRWIRRHCEERSQTAKDVFVKSCADCHKLDGQGHEVGPDLPSVTMRYKEALLADILIPYQAIETGYEEYLVDLKDGQCLTRFSQSMARRSN
jgi:hypothetical protein